MKVYVLASILLTSTLYSCQSSSSAENTGPIDQAKEEKEITEVIISETECFFNRDYDCWQDKFTHSEYSYQAWSNADGTFDASVGWENINKNLGKFIKQNPAEPDKEGSSHPLVIRKNMKFKFYGNNASHVTWDQYNSDQDKEYFLHSKEVRLMEKGDDNKWRIVNVSAFWNYKNKIPVSEIQ